MNSGWTTFIHVQLLNRIHKSVNFLFWLSLLNVSLLGCSFVFQGHLSNLKVTEDKKAPPHVHIDGLMRQDCTITPLLMLRIIILLPNEVGGRVYWIHLVRLSVRPSVGDMVSGAQLKFALEFKFHIHIVCGYGQKLIDFQRCHFQNLPPGGYIGFSVSGL